MIVFAIHKINARPNEIIIHSSGNPSHDQIYIEPPYVTYDDDLNELYVYFGTTGTIDLEYDDGTGARLEALKLEGSSLLNSVQK